MFGQWEGFRRDKWQEKINVRNFIQKNYIPYDRESQESDFLAGPSERTIKLKEKVDNLMSEEMTKGVLDAETETPSSICAYKKAYIDKSLELIVGLQTDKPLKRAIFPDGGIKMLKSSLEAYGYTINKSLEYIYTKIKKTHNDGVFSAYTDEMKRVRKSGLLTGLPDAYGRGRIIGDYRRVALYGVDYLISAKEKEIQITELSGMSEDIIREREELFMQISALNDLKKMSSYYGYDISKPACNAHQAIQWTYFAYLAAIKEQNGAAMSLGRVSTFFDIYIERDLRNKQIDEQFAQELIDQFVIKLRMVRFLRTPEYNELFSGDPTWVTEAIGGMGLDGRTLVTRTSYRFLNTINNLGPAPEPNLTILWSNSLPRNFKVFCSQMSIKTSTIQYENDDLMREYFGDDYGIACCVSGMKIGKQMQFFGARVNLAKALLYSINGGIDEISGEQIAPPTKPILSEYLDYDEVMKGFDSILEWLAGLYVNTMNIIHYNHDKYNYEKIQMALHDKDIIRNMAMGIAGLSVVSDSLSAVKYANVKTIRNDKGIVIDYKIEGDYPKFGNDDDKADDIAFDLIETFYRKLKRRQYYRNAIPTLSILTITSNVIYGKKTGNTPDGRRQGVAFAPGANPLHGRDSNGAAASFKSVSKLPYEYAQDGISYTFTILPDALGLTDEEKINNLGTLLDVYFRFGGHHININIFSRDVLIDAMENPDNYPNLTIRVSGYAVNFIKLTREQQMDVISRTFHTGY